MTSLLALLLLPLLSLASDQITAKARLVVSQCM